MIAAPASTSATERSAAACWSAVKCSSPVEIRRRSRIPGWAAADALGAVVVGRVQPVAARRRALQLRERAFVGDPPGADDRHAVAELLDLCEQVAREQHGDALAGEPPDQCAHVAHARRVEPGRRLVEQQQPWIAKQRAGDPEPLPHAVRVTADLVAARAPAGRPARAPTRSACPRRSRRRRRAARGSCARSGRGRSAAPRRTPRRRRERGRRRAAGRDRTGARSPPSGGSDRAASAATSSCPLRSARGSRRRHPHRPSGRHRRPRRSRRSASAGLGPRRVAGPSASGPFQETLVAVEKGHSGFRLPPVGIRVQP